MSLEYQKFFPYDTPRESQDRAIKFAIEAFESGKKYVVIEAGTGVGKSAIGLTISQYICDKNNPLDEGISRGSWYLTTQKVLQDQYIKDFGKKGMRTIKSASNYQCTFKKGNDCSETQKLLKVEEKGSKLWNACAFKCHYKKDKEAFIDATDSVTNFPYFLTEASYSGKITPRELLVVDEAHNTESELSKFVEVAVSERFVKTIIKSGFSTIKTQHQAYTWMRDVYYPRLSSHMKHIKSMTEKFTGIRDAIKKDFVKMSRQLDLVSSHYQKIKTFLNIYDKENWVFELLPAGDGKSRRIQFKPIDVSPYAEPVLFKFGKKVLMMSATILDKDAFCESLGIEKSHCSFISLPTPFPAKNRPVISVNMGRMVQSEIDRTLPKLVQAVKQILSEHKNEKGIIHAHSYKIANYIKRNIRSSRILVHDSSNREEVLRKHMTGAAPTVLLSPSMTEGVDLVDDASRFQIICKIPYPYLGDKLVKKRMNKWRWWYALQTTKTIVQSVGRSIRSEEDHAVTYILDSDFSRFYQRNTYLFPESFRDSMV